MENNNDPKAPAATPEPTPAPEPTPQPTPSTEPAPAKTFTQDEVNKLVGEARVKARNQASDDLKDLQEKLEAAEKAKADAEAEAATLKANAEKAAWREQAAKEAGVPASIVKGDTLEDMQAHASAIAEAFNSRKRYTPVPENNDKTPKPVTREEIAAVKNTSERLAMIAENIDLYKN